MLKRAGQWWVWLMLALFLAALGWILALRLGSGEIYPEYSSLRADPMGAKAFHESLGRLQNLEVDRNLQPLGRLRGQPNTTVLLLGARNASRPDFYEHVERIAREGTRVLVALNASPSFGAEREEDRVNRPAISPENDEKEGETPKAGPSDVPGIGLVDPLRREEDPLLANRAIENPALPDALLWHGRYCFEKLSDEWQTIFEVKGKPVVIEREIGLGTIVFSADSFPFSNEALAHERSLPFLLWALGSSQEIVFEETHLGVRHGSSIMSVLREFRLQGLFFGFLAVAALWIWKSSISFIPPTDGSSGVEVVQGKTAREGVIHLLERNLAADQLPGICLAEWRKSHPNLNSFEAARYAAAEEILGAYQQRPKSERNPIQTYHEITNTLSK